MEYLLLLIPLTLIIISFYYNLKIKRHKQSGWVPELMQARMNATLLLVIGLVLVFIFFLIKNL